MRPGFLTIVLTASCIGQATARQGASVHSARGWEGNLEVTRADSTDDGPTYERMRLVAKGPFKAIDALAPPGYYTRWPQLSVAQLTDPATAQAAMRTWNAAISYRSESRSVMDGGFDTVRCSGDFEAAIRVLLTAAGPNLLVMDISVDYSDGQSYEIPCTSSYSGEVDPAGAAVEIPNVEIPVPPDGALRLVGSVETEDGYVVRYDLKPAER